MSALCEARREVLAQALDRVRSRMAAAAERADRNPNDVILVAVSKTRPPSDIVAALACSHNLFGENYAQELRDKSRSLASAAQPLVWHFIGALQRNKVKYVVGTASLIHAVHSVEVATDIDRRASALHRVQDVLIEVNVGRDPRKQGVLPEELHSVLSSVRELTWVRCVGLMTMPPQWENQKRLRSIFRTLRELAGIHGLRQLSMGTTLDYEIAIEEGATLVRIGTAIFGGRDYRSRLDAACRQGEVTE